MSASPAELAELRALAEYVEQLATGEHPMLQHVGIGAGRAIEASAQDAQREAAAARLLAVRP